MLDLFNGSVVFVGEGKGARALEPFRKRLKFSRARIEAVAMDRSRAYIAAVCSALPDAIIVFDRFHVILLMHDKLTAFRRGLYREATDLLQQNVLKGILWLIVKNPKNFTDDRNERVRLEEARTMNKPLAAAY